MLQKLVQANGKVGNEEGIYSYMGYIYWKNGQYESAMASIRVSLTLNRVIKTFSRATTLKELSRREIALFVPTSKRECPTG